jgi:hypothetical protein
MPLPFSIACLCDGVMVLLLTWIDDPASHGASVLSV